MPAHAPNPLPPTLEGPTRTEYFGAATHPTDSDTLDCRKSY